jgi:hypothetical protein
MAAHKNTRKTRLSTTTVITLGQQAGIPNSRDLKALKAFKESHPNAEAAMNTWFTPLPIVVHFDADTDPACDENMPHKTAKTMLTVKEDGLATPWKGFVFMNPPYCRQNRKSIADWMRKLADHGNGVALINGDTSTNWFHELVFGHPNVAGILFVKGRLKFANPKGKTLANMKPTVIVAYGPEAERRVLNGLAKGVFKGQYFQYGQAAKVTEGEA